MPHDTGGIRLRGVEEGDEAAVLRLLSDERVVRHMSFPRFTPGHARAFVERCRAEADQRPRRSLTRVLARPDDPAPVGLCGLVLNPHLEDGEAWYLLDPALWGRGLVSEAVEALLRVGFGEMGLHRVWATCLPENPASARVLEKAGFRREGYQVRNLRIQGEWRDSFLYALLRSEWEGRTRGLHGGSGSA